MHKREQAQTETHVLQTSGHYDSIADHEKSVWLYDQQPPSVCAAVLPPKSRVRPSKNESPTVCTTHTCPIAEGILAVHTQTVNNRTRFPLIQSLTHRKTRSQSLGSGTFRDSERSPENFLNGVEDAFSSISTDVSSAAWAAEIAVSISPFSHRA